MRQTQKPTLAIFTTSDFRYDQRMQRMSMVFTEKDYQVKIFSRYFFQNHEIPGKEIVFVSCFFKKSFWFYAEFNLRLLFSGLFQNSDMIYAVDADTLPAAAILKFILRKKMIYDAHELMEESPEIQGKKFIQSFWESVQKIFVPFASCCITVGTEISKILEKKYKREFHVIRNVPQMEMHVSNPAFRKNIIWYQGAVNIGRGLEQMIISMKLLPDYEFHIAGDGDILESLILLTKENKLDDQIKFLGKCTPEMLRKESQKAKVGINLLSDQSLSYYLSLANKTFDYIAAGLPAIHMNFPEYQNLINKFQVGVTIPNLHSDHIVSAVRLIENNYNEYYENCLKAHDILNWKQEQIKWEKILILLDLYRM